MEFLFKKLVVWQKSIELVRIVYQMIKKFPAEERYGPLYIGVQTDRDSLSAVCGIGGLPNPSISDVVFIVRGDFCLSTSRVVSHGTPLTP